MTRTEVIAQMDNAGDPSAPRHAHADEHELPVQAEGRHQKNFTDPIQIVTRVRPGGSPKELR